MLRLRVRYFSDGVVLGSRNDGNGAFEESRERFGERRRTGARPMRGLAALGHWMTLRDLRVCPMKFFCLKLAADAAVYPLDTDAAPAGIHSRSRTVRRPSP
ncbi:MAG TPA: hypothetical protein PKM73_01455 [Verrucomicrobiota bacterium]|nr:hypothetical protein [Verrucomicrobiota bacterium]HNU49334.1 hypothetical protein [Verrucomicrobiota bacterium]